MKILGTSIESGVLLTQQQVESAWKAGAIVRGLAADYGWSGGSSALVVVERLQKSNYVYYNELVGRYWILAEHGEGYMVLYR